LQRRWQVTPSAFHLAVRACPDCPTVREARRLVFDADLWPNLAAALAPFALALVIVWAVVRFLDPGRSDDRAPPEGREP
jgi:hypothetical protein